MAQHVTLEEYQSQICTLLELNRPEKWKTLTGSILENGRQVLFAHKNDLGDRVYREQVESEQSDLLKLLKQYVEQTWFGDTPSWFQEYLRDKRNSSESQIYNRVLIRSANYGSRFLKRGLILSVIVQLVYEFTDNTMVKTTVFDDVCKVLIINGRQGILQRQDDLSGSAQKEQLETPNSVIFLALKEHYKQPLHNFLIHPDVDVTNNKSTEIVLNCITEHGWWKAMREKAVADEISKNKRIVIEEKLVEYFKAEGLPIPSDPSIIPPIIPPIPIPIPIPPDPPIIPPITTLSPSQIKEERELVKRCIGDDQKLSLNDLVMAGELTYSDQTLDDVLRSITDEYSHRRNFPSFIRACLTPIMYLLKRSQNLDRFVTDLFQNCDNLEELLNVNKLNLRMLIDVLLLKADFSLSRKIMILLSKRNPVPFLQPTLDDQSLFRFVPEIMHVWDFLMPSILSFGIGDCQGKSTLLNNLFLCSFEQRSSSIYFLNTIDIDFGYNFLPRRSAPIINRGQGSSKVVDEGRAMNIADAHGSMTKTLLKKIHSIFDGFIIHVTHEYLLKNLSIILDQLSEINEPDKYLVLFVRDIASDRNLDQFTAQLNDAVSKQENGGVTFTRDMNRKQRGSHASIPIVFLIDMSRSGDKSIQTKHTTLRNQILDQLPRQSQVDQDSITRVLNKLIDEGYKSHLQRVTDVNKHLTHRLIDTAIDPSRVAEYFPEYRDFVRLCDYHLRSARFNFYGSENDSEVYAVRRSIYDLEEKLKKPSEHYSIIFELFVNILKSFDMITCLELLSTQLKDKQKDLVSTGDMAMKLPIEKSLSLEVLWRNTIVCSHHLSQDTLKMLCGYYSKYIDAGFPFEIVDGDNFYFQQPFLMQSLQPYRNNRILVISIIGPQNSGKSTLLNYMFGTLFDVRDGRCTRGIYGSFVKAHRSDYDYLMLIDSEGLLSIEREDKEYDRRIVLFCLAVSHVVLVNMSGEISTTLQDMLKLCASSLKELGVKTIPRPIVHFILNQRADLNIENHHATIRKVVDDLKRDGLNEWIDIREETFHVLPSAFIKDGQASNPKLGNPVKTASEFIECVRKLTGKILDPVDTSLKRKLEITDPLQWLPSSFTVFDILRKFPDLTYYQDINERRIDNELREHIRNYLTKVFSSDYRDALLVESLDKDEKGIEEIFTIRQSYIHKSAEEEMDNLFKLLKVPDALRRRTREFMRAQIIQMFQANFIATMAANERKRVEFLVQNREGDLKRLIEATIDSGKTLSAADAKTEFKTMYDKTIAAIVSRYVPNERLREALRHIYTNYNIYEKDFLYEYERLIDFVTFLQRINETKLSMNQLEDAFIGEFTRRGHQEPSVCAVTFNPGGTTLYSYEIIDNLVFLNKELLRTKFSNFIGCSTPEPSSTHQKKGVRETIFGYISGGSSRDKKDERQESARSTDPFQAEIREAIKTESTRVSQRSDHNYDDRSNYVPVSKLVREVVQRVSKAMQGAVNGEVRQIKTELIQRIVGLVNSMITEVKTELGPFCLELSRPLKSVLHTCTIISLTKYYYDEQMNHFRSTLNELDQKRGDLESYFISVVVPDSLSDENFARSLVRQLNDYLMKNYADQGQQQIKHVLKQYEHINRKWVQDKCDGLLLSNTDLQWNLDYIKSPNKIIENYFINIWSDIEKSINQQLEKLKSENIAIINQFLYCSEGMLDMTNKFGAPVKFVDEAFQANGNNGLNVNENLIRKQKCMTVLFKEYFITATIPENITVDGKTYTLRQDILGEFQLLIMRQSARQHLSTAMKALLTTLEKIFIQNFSVFLKCFIAETRKVHIDFNQCKSDFQSIDRQDTYATLLDKVCGCTELCPCCKRPCDVDHTQIKSNPGAEFNEHGCDTGHSLRGMNGYMFEETGEPSLFMCEQIQDEQEIIVGPTRYLWSQFKIDHSDWKFSSGLPADVLSKLHGKYLTVWERIGPKICEIYGMKYVVRNTPRPLPVPSPHPNPQSSANAQPFHYILLLDKSGSMAEEAKWINLMKAVTEFLQTRRNLKMNDRFSIITFTSTATAVFINQPLDMIKTSNLGTPDGGTSFVAAFQCVIDTIEKVLQEDKSKDLHDKIAILFMTDGEAPDPNAELQTLKTKYQANIQRFWTIALCAKNSPYMKKLEAINTTMKGEFYTAEKATALSKTYAEIASKS